MRTPRQTSSGFTYLGVLLLVALMGALLGAAGEVWHTVQRREAERDLRFIGEEFRRAIGHYYQSTPGLVKRYPQSLNDLLNDKRYPGVRRYLRRIYRDPITTRREWGIVEAPGGGIAGVYSLSDEEPIGSQHLVAAGAGSATVSVVAPTTAVPDEKRNPRYSDWRFVFVAPSGITGAAAPPPGTAAAPGGAAR